MCLVCILAACGGDDDGSGTSGDGDGDGDRPDPATITQEMAGLTVELTNTPVRLRILDPDGNEILSTLDGDGAAPYGFAAFRTGEVVPPIRQFVGSFEFEEEAGPWAGLGFIDDIEASSEEITFTLSNGGTGSITAVADRTLQVKLTDTGNNRSTVAFECADNEAFMGFGGQAIDVDHRGHTFPLFVKEGGNGRLLTEEPVQSPFYILGTRHQTSVPIPFFVSSEGYGFLGDGFRYNKFSMCEENESAWRYETWQGDMSFHVFYGPEPLDVLERHTALVGRPDAPPNYVFAPWTDAIRGSANVRQFMNFLRDQDIPTSVVWSEDWAGASGDGTNFFLDQNWLFDDFFYPDLPQLTDDLHDIGIKFQGYFSNFAFATPATDPDYQSTHLEEGMEMGYFFTQDGATDFQDAARLPFQTAYVDLYNEDAVDWMIDFMNLAMDAGVDGWMADYGEWVMLDVDNAAGMDQFEAHNRYPVEWARVNSRALSEREAIDGIERVSFHRSANNGSQQFDNTVMWGGDQATSFELGDGLPSALAVGINQGVSGLVYWGSDIAGYAEWRSDPERIGIADGPCITEELWYRWVEFGAFSPIMRSHHGRRATQNWHLYNVIFGPPAPPGAEPVIVEGTERCPELPDPSVVGINMASVEHWKRYAKLHTQLAAYQFENAEQAAATGAPLMRAMGLMFPDDLNVWGMTDQYMFGPDILVAPVIEEGALSRDVYLPAGDWMPFEGGATITGPSTESVAAPVGEIPAFVRAGTVIPLLPATVDTLVRKSDYDIPPDTDVVYLEDVETAREVRVYLGADGKFTESRFGLTYTLTHDHKPSGSVALTAGGTSLASCAEALVPPCAEIDVARRVATAVVRGNQTVVLSDAAGEAARLETAGGSADRELRVVVRW